MSNEERIIYVKAGFLRSIPVKVCESIGRVELSKPVTIGGVTITECSGYDSDAEDKSLSVARRNFAYRLLRAGGYSEQKAEKLSEDVRGYWGER